MAATLLELGWPEGALRLSGPLLAAHPAENAAFYVVHAAALRAAGRVEEQLVTLTQAVTRLPSVGLGHSQYCWYGTLYEEHLPAGAPSLDASCDAAVEHARDTQARALALGRRALRRAHRGDFAGAGADLDAAFADWAAAGLRPERLPYPWPAWRVAIAAGRDPLAGEGLAVERARR